MVDVVTLTLNVLSCLESDHFDIYSSNKNNIIISLRTYLSVKSAII